MNLDNMKKFLHLLETTNKPKGYFKLYHKGAFCAVGLCAHELLGIPTSKLDNPNPVDPVYDAVENFLGVPDGAIWSVSDISNSFGEVAARLRKNWGLPA